MKRQLVDWLRFCFFISTSGIFILTSCGDKENIVIFTRPEVIRLLSNDSTKSWERKMVYLNGQPEDMTDCDLFTSMQLVSESDSLKYITKTQADYCNGTSVKLDSGFWDVLEESSISDRIDRIAYYSADGDTIIKQIQEITALFLITEYNSGGNQMRESFESGLPY